MLKKTTIIMVSLLVLLGFTGCGSKGSDKGTVGTSTGTTAEKSAGSSGEKIKIGAILPLTGSSAKPGQDSYNSIEIATEMINDAGGVNNKKIELVKSDAPDATAAVSEANRLITQEGIKILLGSYTSGNALGIAQVAEKNQVFFLETIAIDPTLVKKGYKYVFRPNPDANSYADTATEYINTVLAKSLNKKPSELRVAIVAEDSSFGQNTGDRSVEKLKGYGFQVVDREDYNSKVLDLSSLIMKVKETKPDIIVASQYNNDANLFWKQSKELGLRPLAFVANGGGYANSEFLKASGPDSEAVIVSCPSSSTKMDSLPADTQKVYQDFLDRYQKKFGAAPSTQALTVFSSTWAFLHGILPKATDPNNADSIRKAAMEVDLPEGSTPSGWGVKFDENGQNSRGFSVVMQWQNQKLSTIYPDKYAVTKMSGIPLAPWGKK